MVQKVIIIDGISTILTEGSFLKDEIPRILSNYINEGFNLWLNDDNIGIDLMDYPCIPFWLKQSLVFITKEIIMENEIKFDKSSFIITNDYNRASEMKLNINIFTSNEIFKVNKYNKLNIADVVLCFGFNVIEFNNFCRDASLIGFYENNLHNKNEKSPDGIAFLIDNDSDITQEYTYILKKVKELINKNKYKIKHNEYMIGVTYKGQGVNRDLNILNGQQLPLLLI